MFPARFRSQSALDIGTGTHVAGTGKRPQVLPLMCGHVSTSQKEIQQPPASSEAAAYVEDSGACYCLLRLARISHVLR